MSVKIMSAVFESSLPPTRRLVALALADYASDDGRGIYPSAETVAAKTGLSRRSVLRTIADLRDSRLLVVEGEREVRGGRIPVYRLAVEAIPRLGASVSPSARESLDPVPESPRPSARVAPEPTTEPKTRTVKSRRSVVDALNECSIEGRALVEKLVELVVVNGSRRPIPTAAWYDEARRLLGKDGVSFAEAMAVLTWCQGDEFWRANVLSIPTFRAKFDTLRLQMRRSSHPSGRGDVSDETLVAHIEDARSRRRGA